MKTLQAKTHWIFDMDGTLTNAIHDFEAIKHELGLPGSKPILESIAELPKKEAFDIKTKLDEMEYDIAAKATAQPYAHELLSKIQQQGHTVGIVTRNGHGIAKATLTACALDHHFTDASIISRDCAPPKPAPDGVELLLSRWTAEPQTAVMVGDYLFDLEAGKRAGLSTVHLDVQGNFEWPDFTDHCISSLNELVQLWKP